MSKKKIDILWSAYEKASTHFEQRASEGHEIAETQAFTAVATGTLLFQAEQLERSANAQVRIADALEKLAPLFPSQSYGFGKAGQSDVI